MQERDRIGVFFEKAGNRLVEHADLELDVIRHFRKFLLRKCANRVSIPVFRNAFERIEAMNRSTSMLTNSPDRLAPPDPEFKVEPRQRRLMHNVFDELRVLFKIRSVRHVRLDVVDRILLGVELKVDKKVRSVVLQDEAPKEKLAQGTFE